MSKPFPLQPLVQLAHQKNDAATRKLGQLNQQQQTAQGKLEALQQYRRDYQIKLQEALQQGMEPVALRNFQDFIERLDKAILQQNQVIEKAKKVVQNGRHELMDTTRKMKSFDTLEKRHVESEMKLEAKSEQRMQDEQTGRFAAQHAADKRGDK